MRVEATGATGCGRMLVGVRRVALMVEAHARVELDLCGACDVDATEALLGEYPLQLGAGENASARVRRCARCGCALSRYAARAIATARRVTRSASTPASARTGTTSTSTASGTVASPLL